MEKNIENNMFETALCDIAKMPTIKIDRELFLRKELKEKYSKEIIDKVIEHNPAYAGITVEEINKIAKKCIAAETKKVTAISAVAGLPGGFAMLGAIPADFAQYFAHVLRIIQELMYLYGWGELNLDSEELDEETKSKLTLFVGIMFGVGSAVKGLNMIAAQLSKRVLKELPKKSLTKGAVYPIVKKVSVALGAKMSKDIFAKGASKVIPVAGAIVSGGVTLISYKRMTERLREYLTSCELADVNQYKNIDDEKDDNSET